MIGVLLIRRLVASAPSSANRVGPPGPTRSSVSPRLRRGSHIASEDAAERAVELFTDYLASIDKIAPVAFWTPARQLELAKWCVEKRRHSAGYIERSFNVMRSAFNDACVTKIRLDAVGNKVETCADESRAENKYGNVRQSLLNSKSQHVGRNR